MNITIHRGTHEIGGSCVEISSGNSRIVIDLGMPLVDKGGEKFDFKKYKDLSGPELVKQKILSDIPGFYEWDKSIKAIDGILISHPHIDHYGFFKYLRKDICFYLGEAAKKLIDLSVIFTPVKGKIHKYRPIENEKPFTVGDFTITPFLMDHSGFDAYAFLIEADGKSIIYSGDFREYGRKPGAFRRFLKNAPKNVNALLLEGTMFGRTPGKYKSEEDVEDETVDLAKKSDHIIFLCFSPQNIDRLVSFHKASRSTKRLFVIDPYAANILDALKDSANLPHPSPDYENFRVFFSSAVCNMLKRQGKKKLFYKFKKYKITKDEISQRAGEIMMLIRTSTLINMKGIEHMEGAAFIYSMWKGYLQYESNKKLNDFIRKRNMKFHHIHFSGHATTKTLKKVVEKLKPKNIIPIHTFHPEQYQIFGDKVKYLSDGELYEV